MQAVISAAQVREKSAAVYIPTPDATQLIDFYPQHYNRHFKLPKSLIKFSNLVEDCVGSAYCMDEIDDAWLKDFNSNLMMDEGGVEMLNADDFETVISELERLTDAKQKELAGQYASLEELESYLAMSSLSLNATTLSKLYDHWHSRRSKRDLAPIMPQLRVTYLTRISHISLCNHSWKK